MNSQLCICVIVYLIVATDVVSGKGFKGMSISKGFSMSKGGISKGSISKSGSNIRISETRVKVRYGSRYKPWNHGYNNWWSYGSHGHIYGFVWYTRTSYYRDHPHREPTICRNEFDNVMDNGTHYSWFICPSDKHTSDYHYCCGEEDKQYCCRFWDDGWRTFGVVVSFLFFFVFVSALCYCCCCRKKTHTETTYFQRMMSRKISSREGVDIPPYPAPSAPSEPQQQPYCNPMEPFIPQPIQQPGFMPMPQPQPGFVLPPAQPMPPPMPEMQNNMFGVVPPMPGIPPYPVEGGAMLPPSYTPYPPQPSAPPYPMDSSLPHQAPISGQTVPFQTVSYPTGPGYPNSPPPPYGQIVKENNP